MMDNREYEFQKWKTQLTTCYDSIENADTVAEKNKHWQELYQLSKKAHSWNLTSSDVDVIIMAHKEGEKD